MGTLVDTLRWIEAEVEALAPPAPPAVQVEITAQELRTRLHEVAGNVMILLAEASQEHYRITTRDEMLRFLRWARVYKMRWQAEAPDCDDFTRKLKGALVCKGWRWQPALDCWFQVNGGHSEFITLLLDENNEKQVYLIECQKEFDMFELAYEVFEEHQAYLIKQ